MEFGTYEFVTLIVLLITVVCVGFLLWLVFRIFSELMHHRGEDDGLEADVLGSVETRGYLPMDEGIGYQMLDQDSGSLEGKLNAREFAGGVKVTSRPCTEEELAAIREAEMFPDPDIMTLRQKIEWWIEKNPCSKIYVRKNGDLTFRASKGAPSDQWHGAVTANDIDALLDHLIRKTNEQRKKKG